MSPEDRAPLHVCVVAACPFPEPRGTPVRILKLSEAVAARGHRVSVLTYHLGRGDPPESLEVHRIRPVRAYTRTAPGPSIGKLLALDPLLVKRVRRFLAKETVDVVHAHHYEGLLVATIASRGRTPVAYDAHTLLRSELPEYGIPVPRGLLAGVGGWLDRHLPRRADHVFAVTPALAARFRALGIEPGRVTVAAQGVEDIFFEHGAGGAPPAGPPRIGYAGNLAPYQGIDSLLDAFAVVRAERPDARLHVLSGSSFDPYEARAAALGIRDAIDLEAVALPELPRALRASHVLVNPRHTADGIPIKLLNYMAVGRPIATFDGSFPIEGDGEIALRVPSGDAPALGRAILTLLDEPARADAVGSAGRDHALAHHRWGAIAETVEEVYRRLARGDVAGGRA